MSHPLPHASNRCAAGQSPAATPVRAEWRTWVFRLAGAALAAELVWRLSPIWVEGPDGALGWAVPIAAGYLAIERWTDRPSAAACDAPSWLSWIALLAGLVVLTILRLALEPWPLWPAALWLFAVTALGLAFGGLMVARGLAFARHFLFPFGFVLAALPWPSAVDVHLIMPLREALASVAANVLGLIGYPAIARGTVLQVGRGFVGVDEACSGIRSLQAAMMAALFLGELYRFRGARRAALLAIGLALAVASNLVRTLVLAWQAARAGEAGVLRWHDATGYALLAFCLGGLAFICWRCRRHGAAPAPRPSVRVVLPLRAARLSGALVVALCLIEVATQFWFMQGERRLASSARWTATLHERPGFQPIEFTPVMQALLGCDTHELGRWRGDDGTGRSGYILRWRRGQSARSAIEAHRPTACLPYAGSRLVTTRGRIHVRTSGPVLPFDAYIFATSAGALHVYYLAWDVREGRPLPSAEPATGGRAEWIARRWGEVRGARRSLEITVLVLAILDARSDAAADQALEAELAAIIRS